jgi:hypothetical protein
MMKVFCCLFLVNSTLSVLWILVQWLRSFDQRVRESIDYAICLNSVGSWSSDLWMHVSKPPENPYIKQIFEVRWPFLAFWSITSIFCRSHLQLQICLLFQDFSDVSKEMGISVGIKHKKINVSNSRVCSSCFLKDRVPFIISFVSCQIIILHQPTNLPSAVAWWLWYIYCWHDVLAILQVAWEHEQFSRFRVTALTLSELSSPPEFLESTGGLYDTRWSHF